MGKEKLTLKEFLVLNAGVLLMTVGVYFFKFPNGFTTGGVSGISMVISAAFGIATPGWLIMMINIFLLIVGFAVFGRDFGIKTAYCSLAFSGELIAAEYLVPMSKPLTNEPFMELIIAVFLVALGSAILFNAQASSGGTDVVAMILRKYTSLNIGAALMATDFLIACSAFLVFGVETGIYSLLGLALKSFFVDNVIESINLCKYFTVVTSKPDEICAYILSDIHHGVTVLDAVGAFSHENKKVLLVVCRRFESVKLKAKVKELDPGSFIMVTNSSEIIGKGFRGL